MSKGRGHHANNRVARAIERNGAANHTLTATKALLPKPIAKDSHARPLCTVLVS